MTAIWSLGCHNWHIATGDNKGSNSDGCKSWNRHQPRHQEPSVTALNEVLLMSNRQYWTTWSFNSCTTQPSQCTVRIDTLELLQFDTSKRKFASQSGGCEVSMVMHVQGCVAPFWRLRHFHNYLTNIKEMGPLIYTHIYLNLDRSSETHQKSTFRFSKTT